jgi:hypothetical protein
MQGTHTENLNDVKYSIAAFDLSFFMYPLTTNIENKILVFICRLHEGEDSD